MSKKPRLIWLILAAFGLILQFFTFGNGQDIEAKIKIDSRTPSIAQITGRFLKTERPNKRNLTFLGELAGIPNIAGRIKLVKCRGVDGEILPVKQFNAAEYLTSAADIAQFSYEVSLAPPTSASSRVHISWTDAESGLLMLDDLLPQGGSNIAAKLSFDLPEGWSLNSTEPVLSPNVYSVANVEKAVFAFGKGWRQREIQTSGTPLGISISGEWRFTDADVGEMSSSILESYAKTFGGVPSLRQQIIMFHMPPDVPFDRWEAETRGSTVVITSSDMPFDTQSKQRLHEQLRHEMFHLWIPNGVNLGGNYDWFYEGFALYQSLRMGVATNRIRFDDFLDTLSRAITTDRLHSNGMSLIDASKNRFSGSNSTVYARGMVVAFLCDLALLDKSKGKRSVEDLLRDVYQKYHDSAVRADGNEAVLNILAERPELGPIIERYIKKGEVVASDEYFNYAGIEAVTQNSVTTLKVLPKPNSRQKDLLDKLGYNTWRKLRIISK